MPALSTSYKSIIGLALPIIFGTFVQSALLFIDSYFLSMYDIDAFRAVGNAGLLYISFFMLGNALADAGQIYLAGRYGKDDFVSITRGFQTNALNLFVLAIVLMVLVWALDLFILPEIVNSDAVGEQMQSYLSVRPLGYIFTFLTLAITSYFIAVGRSAIMLYNTLLLCGVNAILDYFLIFGYGGFPEMGSQGAALATVAAEAVVFCFSLIFILRDRKSQVYAFFSGLKRYASQARDILRLARPLMIQGFLAVGGWTTYFFMIEQVGEFEIEVSQIIHKLYFLALIPMFGFAAATRTYTSNLLAVDDVDGVKRTMRKILIINYAFVILFVHGNILYPDFWIRMVYNPAFVDPEVIENARQILFLITGSILIHSAAMVFQSLIAGSGHTLMAMKLELISLCTYLTSAYILMFVVEADIVTIWVTEYIYFGTFFILNFGYYLSGKWKKSRTIQI